ncbi:hypothetical protein D3C73_1093860 [compost metagenome]
MFIDFSKILSPVAVISILLRNRIHHLINVINDRADPNRINSKLLQIVQLGCNTGKVSAMIGFCIVFIKICAIIRAVPVEKTVSQQEINACFIPIKIGCGVRINCNGGVCNMRITKLIHYCNRNILNSRCSPF